MAATRALIDRGAVRDGLYDWISSTYPGGLSEDALEAAATAWRAHNGPGLRAVG